MLETTVTPRCAKCRKPTQHSAKQPYAQLFWCDECAEPESGWADTVAHWQEELDPHGEEEELFGSFTCPYCGQALNTDYSTCWDCYHS
jgi:hypothetical protein